MAVKRKPAPKRKVTTNMRTPKTARQKAVEARRKITDQASSASKNKGAKTKTTTKAKRKAQAVGSYIKQTAMRGASPKDLALFSAGMPLVNAASKIAKRVTAPKKAPKATGAGKHKRVQPTVATAKPKKRKAGESRPKRPDNYVSAADRKLIKGNSKKKKRKAPTYRG